MEPISDDDPRSINYEPPGPSFRKDVIRHINDKKALLDQLRRDPQYTPEDIKKLESEIDRWQFNLTASSMGDCFPGQPVITSQDSDPLDRDPESG